MTLPLLVSVPHAGLEAPPEVEGLHLLGPEEIVDDGDGGAAAIYGPLEREAAVFVTTSIARAFVDMNRAEDDRRKDGVVKSHTCWDVPIWRASLPEEVIETLLDRYHRPYHRTLAGGAGPGVIAGVDCHTMAAHGPPVGPDAGKERPAACLGDGDGTTAPRSWVESLARCLEESLEREVRIGEPFQGGYIIRAHAREIPWVQIELSRAPYLPDEEKSRRVLAALRRWVDTI